MRSVNKVILIGNLTRDPELRQTPNGQSVTTFGIATNRQWTTKEGDGKTSAEFHECVAWARLAEICSEYLKKGHLVYVEGYLKTRSWDSPEGIKKFKTEIVVQDMIILEKRGAKDDYDSADAAVSQAVESPVVDDDDSLMMEESKPEAPAATEEAPATEAAATEEAPATEAAPSFENPIDKDLGL